MCAQLRHPQLTILEVVEQLFPYIDLGGEPTSGDGPESEKLPPPYEAWPLPEGGSVPQDYEADPGRDELESLVEIDLRGPYVAPPLSPFDLFAITAQLLELSGAYHHVVPTFPTSAESPRPKRRVQLDSAVLETCKGIAETWRKPITDPSDVAQLRVRSAELPILLSLWDELIGGYGNAPVVLDDQGANNGDLPPPGWWGIALKLMIIADEAAEGIGFELVQYSDDEPGLWFMHRLEAQFAQIGSRPRDRDGDEWGDTAPNATFFDDWWSSLSDARQDVVCVLPKARTAAVGCTLRSLSHHLALLPPRGIASAKWVPAYRSQPPKLPASSQFNVLLVPFPFTISAEEFEVSIDPGPTTDGWGAFRLLQTWRHGYGGPYRRTYITVQLADFVASLCKEAVRIHRADRIDAVVFPELALDARLYRGLERELPKRIPELKLMVSGLSADDSGRHGNYVAVTSLHGPDGISFGTIREKHHRWKLDRSQIEAYGLQGRLDPRRGWWEDIDLLNRRIDFSVFHERSVLAAMICEDLARVDPCQEILRSVGPNLVIALLMDAPQLPTRWPARYATVLAEDPGSSVLTLTSRGLMTHQWLAALEANQQPPPILDPVIALWRDSDSGIAHQIRCPYTAHGVWLKLWGRPTLDQTIDGRRDTTAVGWTLAQHTPLSIPEVNRRYGKLLGEEDQRLRARLEADSAKSKC